MASHAPGTSSRRPARNDGPRGLVTLAHGEQPEIDLEIKRSHFLARAHRTDTMDEAREFIARVRSAYPDARHHCSAMTVTVLSESGAPTASHHPTERSNDDGEPSGTAGQPMLETLRGTGLANTTVVVARYFGGTLLGTGGLVRAYSEATARTLARASRVELIRRHLWDLRVPVAQAGRIEAELRSRDVAGGDHDGHRLIQVEETIWGPTHAVLILATPFADPALLREPLAALTRGEGIAEPAGSRLVEVPLPSSA
ncbi:YigZ family protein [Actinomyces johnsonii F0542]|uniref:YigZ family protein n=1 Tax=Actinomyces johnsonii F0542 TaxID=1321818 RepID=U1S267_9ACTO|nr:YigZ family protein [Actinomyces johnsonii]ERH24752.1 YigZ family protein [Actinomyces johnsonii F0542]